jgi:cob(I)alamin adenosyltransferase
MKKGLLIVFTGNGKGKTTAALGMAMRAAGHGMKVCFIQFIKNSVKYGELEAVKKFTETIDLHRMGSPFVKRRDNHNIYRDAARAGWEFAKNAIASGRYQLVVLDEFTYLLADAIIDTESVLLMLKNRPDHLHIVITGRAASEKILAASDLVTEMQAVKHPLKSRFTPQRGIEF